MNIINIFLNNVKINNKKIAVIFNDKKITYEELEKDVKKFSFLLESKSIKQNTHVIVILNNTYEFVVVMLASANLGSVIIPLSTTLSTESINKVIEITESNYIITTDFLKKKSYRNIKLENIISIDENFELSLDSKKFEDYSLGKHNISNKQAFILTMTSGSTGDPKPIVFSQETKIQRAILGAKELYNLDKNDVILAASPLYHSMGQRLVLLPLLIGGTSVIIQKFTPKIWLNMVSKYKVSFTISISSHLEMIVKNMKDTRYDLGSLKSLVSSSSLLREKVKKECLSKFMCDFHECYGASEVGIVTNLVFRNSKKYIGSVGKALDYVDLKIVDRKKKELPFGEIGEIICKTKTAFLRYYNNIEKTNESLIHDYFYTGDLGYLDKEGYLYLAGRIKDIIIVGGTNVYPVDIEEIVSRVKGVKECCVIGVDDQYFGEAILCTLIVDKNIFTLRDVKLECSRKLADYQQPMAYEIVEELPKNNLGKIMKYKLKEQFLDYDATLNLRRLLKER